MDISLISHPSTTRCYICGSPEVNVICHHCGRSLCRRHGPAKPFLSFFRKNREFHRLGLESSPAKSRSGAHCAECVHSVPDMIRLMVLPGIALFTVNLVGLLFFLALYLPALLEQQYDTPSVLFASFVSGGLILGAVFSTMGVLIDRWLERQEVKKHPLPDLPLIPFIPAETPIVVQEMVRGKIWQTPIYAFSSVESWTGVLRLPFQLGPSDRSRLAAYRQRFKPGAPRRLICRGHYISLVGRKALRWNLSSQWEVLPTVVAATELLYLNEAAEQAYHRDWTQTLNYELTGDPLAEEHNVPEHLPLRLRAYVMPGSDGREVALELQLLPDLPTEKQRLELRLDSLKVEVPTEILGPPRVQVPSAELSEAQGVRQTLTWRALGFKREEQVSGRKEFVLRFPAPVTQATVLSGQVQLSWPGLSSGVEGVNLFFPLGHRDKRADQNTQLWTRLIVNFDLHVAGIVGQQPTQQLSRQVTLKLPCAPNEKFVCQLAEAIAQAGGFYVKNLVENGQQLSAVQGAMACYWDITGRKYNQVHAVDFHLVISGSIQLEDTGQTNVDVRVQGLVNTPQLEAEVEGVLETLKTLVEEMTAT